jgi:hypothetical protein
MKFHNLDGGNKAARWTNKDSEKYGDIRCYKPPRGYNAEAALLDYDVITGKELTQSRFFIILIKKGGFYD